MRDRVLTYANRVIAYSFYGLFFFVPLVLSNSTSELFEFNKMWLAFALTLIVACAWGTKMIVQRQFRIQRTPLDIPLLLFLLSQCISTLISIDRHVSVWGYYSRFNGGLLSILTYVFLYYAFVTNFASITKTFRDHMGIKIGPIGRVSLVAAGAILIWLGILLAKPDPSTAGSSGSPIVLWVSLWTAFFMFLPALPKEFLKRLFLITLTSGAIVSLWGFPSHFGKDPSCLLFRGSFDVSCWTEAFRPTIRTFSTLGQPAWYVAYLSVIVIIAAGIGLAYILKSKVQALNPKNAKHEHKTVSSQQLVTSHGSLFALYVIAAFGYAGVVFGNTRAGFIGFWLGNLVFWGIVLLKKYFNFQTFLMYFLLFNLTFGFISFLWGAPIPVLTNFTLPSLHHTATPAPVATATPASTGQSSAGDLGGTDSGKIRLFVWQGAIQTWLAHPLFGTGVETFGFAYYQYRPAGHNLTSEWDYLYNKAHNEYLNYLATTGLFGLATYAVFIVMYIALTLLWLFRRLQPEDESIYSSRGDRIIGASLLGAFITILISNFFGFSVVIMNMFLFIIPAITIVFMGGKALGKEFLLGSKTEATGAYIGAPAWTGIGILSLITLVLLMNLKHSWNADKAYAMGNNLVSTAGTDTQSLIQGVQYLTKAVAMRPSEPVFKDALMVGEANIASIIMLQKSSTQSAQLQQEAQGLITEAKTTADALTTEYPHNIVFWKDKVRMYNYLAESDPTYLTYALQAIKQTTQLAPTDAKVWYTYGALLYESGNTAQASEVLQQTIKLKPDYRDAYYALALAYRAQAIDKNDKVINQDAEMKAVNTMHQVLQISPKDPDVIKTLKSWNEQ